MINGVNNPKGKGVLGDLADWVLEKIQAVAEAIIGFCIETSETILTSITTGLGIIADDKSDETDLAHLNPIDPTGRKKKGNNLPEIYYQKITEYQKERGVLSWFKMWGLIILFEFGIMISWLKMTLYEASKQAISETTPERPDFISVLNNYLRNAENPEIINKAEEYRKQLGFGDSTWSFIREGNRSILSLSEAMELSRRQSVLEEEKGDLDEYLVDHIKKLGYNEDDALFLADLKWHFPTPSDVVRFKVKEVYDEQYMFEWGGDDNAEPGDEYYQDAAKVGISEYWAKKYWRAHWQIPSVYQGFEMLHRGKIDRDQLEYLLKAKDIMPGWREKLLDISYRRLSRVDVRRMYKTGVFNPDELFEQYSILGYNDLDAQRMADFTVGYYEDPERDLTKSDLLRAYRDNHPAYDTEKEVIDGLYQLGYDQFEAQLIVSRETYRKEEDEWKDRLASIKIQYVKGNLTWSQVVSVLRERSYSEHKIHILQTQFDNAKLKETPVVNRTVWDKLLAYKLTSELLYRAEMGKRSYTKNQIDTLILYCQNCIKVD